MADTLRLADLLAAPPPDSVDRANALRQSGDYEASVAMFGRMLANDPDDPEALFYLAMTWQEAGHLDEAVACYRRAVYLRSDLVSAWNNLGNALLSQGLHDEAREATVEAIRLQPDIAAAGSNLLLCEQYCQGANLTDLDRMHRAWERQYPVRVQYEENDDRSLDYGRCLRVGFVTPDFRHHPVGLLSVRALEQLKDRWELVAYNTSTLPPDDMTKRIMRTMTEWNYVTNLSDDDLAAKIRADQIDILFDFSGHTRHNRLSVFARKPAPIQISWLGYVGTTGLSAMDYVLADRFHVPVTAEPHYREQILRMPDVYSCFDPPGAQEAWSDPSEYLAPDVGPLPALKNRYVTFGCFNNVAKITDAVLDTWAEILRRVPRSRLILASPGLNGSRARARIIVRMAQASDAERCGFDAGRIELIGCQAPGDLLALYNRVDVALDPFPYSGGLTTLEALWMGVPVVTLPGETFASRHALAYLSNLWLLDGIADDARDYVERAVRLAGNLDWLVRTRASLRERLVSSPICDGERFAVSFAKLMRSVWAKYVESVPVHVANSIMVRA
jgi:predicted O-linked N-acetylglucosamine transferase (SPINDLY family)